MKQKRAAILFVIFIIIFAVILSINSYFNLFSCNMRKELKGKSDTQIHDISDKIARLEKEPVKDVTTVGRLAQQYMLLGSVYLEKKMWDMAIDAMQKAMKYGESGAAVFYQMGLAYANKGYDFDNARDFETAEQYYRKSLEKQPGYNDAAYGLAILLFYHRNGRDEAMKIVAEIIERNPSFYPARFAQAKFYYESGNKADALKVYEILHDDLSKLPESGMINEYRDRCKENITQIMAEMSAK